MNVNLYEEIVQGTSEIFSSMLMIELDAGEVIYDSKPDISSNISSMIGLGGGIKGVVAVHCSENVAKNITGGFLGMEIETLDEDVKDAIGEIANMVAGNLKISFEKNGVDVQLAIPTSIIGDSFRISGFSKANCVTVPLIMNGDSFWIELKYIDKNS